jgi:hypothetical protein
MNWIQLADGQPLDLDRPGRALSIQNMAKALARIPRFVGATVEPYSVAQHAVLCAQAAPHAHRLAALLHDGHEIVTGDIPKPVKILLGEALAEAVAPLDRAIEREHGLAPCALEHPTVTLIDRRLFATEVRDLMPRGRREIGIDADPLELTIDTCWPAAEAERRFLRTALEVLVDDKVRAEAALASDGEAASKAGVDHFGTEPWAAERQGVG